MNTIKEFNHEKTTQAINVLAELRGGKINKMTAIKDIWLADRYHLRKYGRPITNDIYLAMNYGPVGSSVKDIVELSDFLSEKEKKYASKFIEACRKHFVKSIKSPDLSVFSETDIEVLKLVHKHFHKYSQFDLADYSHKYPEWKKHEDSLQTSTRVPMNYNDFFEDPEDTKDEFFTIDPDILSLAKETFEENVGVSEVWK